MNIKTKLLLSIGLLTGMIILLVSLSVIYLQMLTAAEPDSPIASTGLKQAVVWVAIIGGICIVCGITLAIWLPQSINRPIKELTDGILEIANRNYEKRLNISDKNEEFKNVVDSFNSWLNTDLPPNRHYWHIKNFSKQLSIASAIP